MRWSWFVLLIVAIGLAGCASTSPVAAPATVAAEAPALPTDTPVPIDADNAARLKFFQSGGIWSVVPPGEAAGETVLVLVQKDGLATYPEITVGTASVTNAAGGFPIEEAKLVLQLLDADTATWNQFLGVIADQVGQGQVDAYTLTVDSLPADGKVSTAGAQSLDRTGVLALLAPAEVSAAAEEPPATATPTRAATAIPTATSTPDAATPATAAAEPAAAEAGAVAAVVVPAIPAVPVVPAVPKIELPELPAIPTVAVPVIPALPTVSVPAVGDVTEPSGGATTPTNAGVQPSQGMTLTAVLANTAAGSNGSVARASLDLVVAEDGQALAALLLHLAEVKCGSAMVGALDQTYSQPTAISAGQFTLPLAGDGAIQGTFTAPGAAIGTARLIVDLPFIGQCDLGTWEWQTAP